MAMFSIPFGGYFQRGFAEPELSPRSTISFYPSNSDCNDFIPYHALQSGRLVQEGVNKSLIYSLDVPVHPYFTKKNHEKFFESMMWSEKWTNIAKKNLELDYRCRAGQLVELTSMGVIVPLATLAINKAYMFSIDKSNPDFSQFFLIIDKAFATEDKYANMYKAFSKYYVDQVDDYISIVYTKSLVKMCYKHSPIIPAKPRTIAEAQQMNRLMTYRLVQSLINQEPI